MNKSFFKFIITLVFLSLGEGWGGACFAQEKTCQQLLDDARQSYNTRDFDACIKNCNKILKSCKEFDFNQTNLYLISSYIEKNEKDSAAQFLKKAVAKKPDFLFYKETETDEFQLLCKQYNLNPKLKIGVSAGFHIPMCKITTYNSVFPSNTVYKNTVWDVNNLQLFSAIISYRLNWIITPYLQYSYFQNNFNRTINLNYEPVQKYIDENEKQKISLTTCYFETKHIGFGKIKRDGIKDWLTMQLAVGIGYAYCKSTINRIYKDDANTNNVVENFGLTLSQKGNFVFPVRFRLSKTFNKITVFADCTYINFRNLGEAKSDDNLSLNYNHYYAQDEKKIRDLQFQIGISYSTFSMRKK